MDGCRGGQVDGIVGFQPMRLHERAPRWPDPDPDHREGLLHAETRYRFQPLLGRVGEEDGDAVQPQDCPSCIDESTSIVDVNTTNRQN